MSLIREAEVEPDTIDRGSALNPRYVLGLLIRYRWEVGAIVATALIAGLLLTLLITPRYTAVASVQIDQQAQRVLQSQDSDPVGAYQDADRFLKTQVDVLRSWHMARRVASELRFLNDTSFLAAMHEPPLKATLDNQQARRVEAVLSTLNKGLGVYLPADSRVVQISFVSPDPQLSARVANTFATSYLRYNLERRYDSSAYARDFLSRQLADAKARLERSERQSNAFARRIGLIRMTAQGDDQGQRPLVSVTTASLSQLNAALNEAHAARIAAEAKWRRVQAASPIAIAEVVNNQAIQALIGQRSVAQANLQSELARHQDDYPTVAPLRAQIANTDAQLSALARDIRSTIADEYKAASQRERQMQAQVSGLKGESLGEQDRSVQLNILNREVDTNRALYDALLQRFKEMSAEAGIATSNVSLIDEARAPFKPSSPHLKLNLAMALFAGLILAGAFVFLREQLDDRVRRPEDVELKLGLRPLGVIPLATGDKSPLELLSDSKSSIAEAYYAMRTALQLSTREGVPRRLLVTSAQPAEGKTTTSIALARSFSEVGKRVLLLDADLRRPSLHRNLLLENTVGLSTLLTAQNTVEEAVQRTDFGTLECITSGPVPPSPTELLSSERLARLLDHLSDRYDLIVIDAPPVLGLADVPIIAQYASTVFVVRANMAHRGAAKASIRRLRAGNATLLGAAFTQFDFAAARTYGYGSNYGYGEGYQYYQYD